MLTHERRRWLGADRSAPVAERPINIEGVPIFFKNRNRKEGFRLPACAHYQLTLALARLSRAPPRPVPAEEQNQCLAVVNAAINELNRNPKSSSEMGRAVECTYILAAGRYVRDRPRAFCSVPMPAPA